MKKYLIALLLLSFLFGCGGQLKDKKVIAKINNYEITREEFEEEFKDSTFGRVDTLESRKEFLDNLINRKLILQDAQAKGLDRDKSFLKAIEKFWEQSLLKITLDRKTKEVAGSGLVSDKVVEEAYNRMFKEGKTDKTYAQMYNQIKWEITKLKEIQMMNDWIAQLSKKARLEVNYDLLKQDK